MPFTTVPDVSQGDVLTETYLDTYVRANGNFLGNPPVAKVRITANESIPDSTTTAVNWDVEDFDTDGMVDLATNADRITIQTAGIYVITFNFLFDSASNGTQRSGWIELNGTASQQHARSTQDAAEATFHAASVTAVLSLSVDDYVRGMVYHDYGGGTAVNLQAGSPYTNLSAFYVGTG